MCALVEGGDGGGGDKDGRKIEKNHFLRHTLTQTHKRPRDVELCVLLPSASWPDFSVASGSKRLKVFCVTRY